ncbi:MAG TPA: dockerin type I repeat-containing protein [Planctomycetota bacterium]|nr:dockerin type I repeat-containing protein [Planctomycetota bacterium]
MPATTAAPTSKPLATEVGLLMVTPPVPAVAITPTVNNLSELNGWQSGRTFLFSLTLLPGTQLNFTNWTIVQTGESNTKPNVTVDITGDRTASLGAATFKGLGSNTLNFNCDDVALSAGSYTVSVLMADPDLAGNGSWNALNKLSFNVEYLSIPPIFTASSTNLRMFANSSASTTITVDPAASSIVKADLFIDDIDLTIASILRDGTDVTAALDDALVFTDGAACDTGGVLTVNASDVPGSATVSIVESDSIDYAPQGAVGAQVAVTVVPRVVKLNGGSTIAMAAMDFVERKVQIVDASLTAPGDIPVTIGTVTGTSAAASDFDADILGGTSESAGSLMFEASDSVTGVTTVDVMAGNGFIFQETGTDTVAFTLYVLPEQTGGKIEWKTPAPSAEPTTVPLACTVGNLKAPIADITPTVQELYRSNGWATGHTLNFSLTVEPGAILLITDWSAKVSNDAGMNPTATVDITGDLGATLGSGTFTSGMRTINVDGPDVALPSGMYTVTLFMQDINVSDGGWLSLIDYTLNVKYAALPSMFAATESSLRLFAGATATTTVSLEPAAMAPVKADLVLIDPDLAVISMAVDGTDVSANPDDAMTFTNGETCDTGGVLAITASDNPGTATVSIVESDSGDYTQRDVRSANVNVEVVDRVVRLSGSPFMVMNFGGSAALTFSIVDATLGAPGMITASLGASAGESATLTPVDTFILDGEQASVGSIAVDASLDTTGTTAADLTLDNGFVFEETGTNTVTITVLVTDQEIGKLIEWAAPATTAAPAVKPDGTAVGDLLIDGVPIIPSTDYLANSNGWATGHAFTFSLTVEAGMEMIITDWVVTNSNNENIKPVCTLSIQGDMTATVGSGTFTVAGGPRTIEVDAPDTVVGEGNYIVRMFIGDPAYPSNGAWLSLVKLSINGLMQATVLHPNVTDFTVTDQTSGSSLITNEATVNVSIAADAPSGTTIDGYVITETPAEPTEGWEASVSSYTIQAASGTDVTLYAWAKDSAGNVGSKAAVIYFNTAAPVASGLAIADNGDGTATATWDTDIPAEGSVKYGAVKMAFPTPNEAAENASGWPPGTAHSVVLSGIAAGANYTIVLVNTEVASPAVFWPQAWPVEGDANMDCRVNILDLIFIRNKLNQDVGTDDNWKADVNGDTRINILDLIFVRNKLNTSCPQ